MIVAPASPMRRPNSASIKNAQVSLPERPVSSLQVRELLAREIAFIGNPIFRELDAESSVDGGSQLPAETHSTAITGLAQRMPAHLERLCSAQLLNPEQERQLFCRMNYLKYRANAIRSTLNEGRVNAKAVKQIRQLLREAEAIRNRIIHANVRLVMSIVKQFADERNPFDDLLSEGLSCLIKAVDKFDFDRGFRFSTYATRAVRREVLRLVQRQHRDRGRFSSGSQELLSQQLAPGDLPEGVHMSWQQVDRSITTMLGQLDDREKFIVQARYGFDNLGEKPTFQYLGELMGISKERVRQLEQRALTKLRELAEKLRLEPAF